MVLPLTNPRLTCVCPMFVCINDNPTELKTFVFRAPALHVLASNVLPVPHAVYNAVPAMVAGSPLNPYTKFVANEVTDAEVVVKLSVTPVIKALAGIVDKSKVAQPLLVVEFKLTISPSFLVPAALTDPVI